MDATTTDSGKPRGLALPLGLLSLAVLAQELLLVRLVAVPLWHHITYMVVTSALLAFGVAGTLLAVFPGLGGRSPSGGRTAFAVHTLLFAATTFVTGFAISRADIDTVDLLKEPRLLIDLFGLYLIIGLPLLFAGLAVTTALRHAGSSLPRLYFVNLVGSGIGCAVFLLALEPLTGPGLLLATAALAAAAAALAAGPERKAILVPSGLVALVALGGVVNADLRARLVPEPKPVRSKDINTFLDQGHRVELTLWNPLCRIDVSDIPGPRTSPEEQTRAKMIFQDGDAPTFLYPPGAPDAMETMVPYLMRPEAKSILVIGAGGGRELALAAKRGLSRIVGCEINSSTVALLRDHYRDFTGDIVSKPGVDLVNAEARSWLARTDERFDFIQMTGVDTYAALNSGAYVASESYLYTQEAFDSYLAHLNEDGCFSIIRLFFAKAERETLRLFVMGFRALQRAGIADPSRHLLVVSSGVWGILVVGKSPLPEARIAEIRAIVENEGRVQTAKNLGIHYDPYRELGGSPFSAYAKAFRDKTEDAFFESYPFNVRPVGDDSPFFYLYHHWPIVVARLLGFDSKKSQAPEQTSAADAQPWLANTGEIPTGQYVLLGLLGQAVLVGFVLVLGPLLAFRARALALPGTFRSILYFSCLGLGFMLLEIALAQKFALFLGHPTRSLAVVIGGMLVASGLGSFASGCLPPKRIAPVAAVLVAALAVGLALFLPKVTADWLRAADTTRTVIALAVLFPVAFLMGMPMPSGLKILGVRSPDLIPWAWGVNGVASVVASILAIILGMEIGFTGVLLSSAGLYLLAALTRPR